MHSEGRANGKATAADSAHQRLTDYVRRTVDAAPPLTAEQRDRLSLLLLRGGDAA